MIHKQWTTLMLSFFTNPWVRGIFLFLYYLAIIAGLILMYGKGDFSTPSFIYQGF
jgi:hypothetical protein